MYYVTLPFILSLSENRLSTESPITQCVLTTCIYSLSWLKGLSFHLWPHAVAFCKTNPINVLSCQAQSNSSYNLKTHQHTWHN